MKIDYKKQPSKLVSLKRLYKILLLSFFVLIFFPLNVFAEDSGQELELGSEYSDYKKETGKKSVNKKNDDRSFPVTVLLYLPNRVLDLLDIIRFDIGVGPAVGAVARVTPYGQAGARFMMPVSLRAGLRGRKSPIFIEHTNELGVGPLFLSSEDRTPTPLEVGVGADLLAVGAYVGISIDSIGDFALGIFGFDPSEDDL